MTCRDPRQAKGHARKKLSARLPVAEVMAIAEKSRVRRGKRASKKDPTSGTF